MQKINLTSIAILIFWVALIASAYVLLSETGPKTDDWPYWDKVQHFFGFSALAVVGFFAYSKQKIGFFVGLAAYGVLTEYLQSTLTATRSGSAGDWLADLAGITVALLFVLILQKSYPKYLQQPGS